MHGRLCSFGLLWQQAALHELLPDCRVGSEASNRVLMSFYIYIYAVTLGGVWAGLRTEGGTQSI